MIKSSDLHLKSMFIYMSYYKNSTNRKKKRSNFVLLPRKHKSFPFLLSYKLIQRSFISSKLMMKVEILQGNHKIFCSGLQKTKAHFMNDHSTTDRNLYTDSVFALFSDKAPNKTSQFLHICKCLFFTKEKKGI